MEVTIGTETLIELAALLTALGAIGGAALWCVRFVARQKRQAHRHPAGADRHLFRGAGLPEGPEGAGL